ncbi:MAG: hypothetical protein V2A34_12460, partial [Lentisphaerota bacterium]
RRLPEARERTDDLPFQDEPVALLFPFHRDARDPAPYFILLEHDPFGHFLRFTIEDAESSRLHLKRIPHREVELSGRRDYRQDIHGMAEQIYAGIHRECHNQRGEYTELPGRQSALFELLAESGLSEISGAAFRWNQDMAERVLLGDDAVFLILLSKLLILLEDGNVVCILAAGNLLTLQVGARRIYIDLSRKGAMLNFSLDAQRKDPDVGAHLRRLPALRRAVQEGRPDALAGCRIVLVHHATTEIMGLIKALDEAGCASLTTLFIRYRGIVPGEYLEDLLSMPEHRFCFHALQNLERRDSVANAYILSRQYSPTAGLDSLDAFLRERRMDYTEAMRAAACHLFFREALAALREKRRVLLIEDGGYVAPLLNRFCREDRKLGYVLEYCGVTAAPDMPPDQSLKEWLAPLIPATFEHTANGYDQLHQVERECGGLAFPAFSIALSRYKNIQEAQACAYSILNAVESVLAGLGRTLLHRHMLVMGSRGHIGSFLVNAAAERAARGGVLGLDLQVDGPRADGLPECTKVDGLPEGQWQNLDLFLGVTGASVLKREFFERLLLKGTAGELFFASGSTKNIEFSDLSDWLNEMGSTGQGRIGPYPVRLETSLIRDPQNESLQGHKVRVIFPEQAELPGTLAGRREKTIFLLGDAMPINFLFYGVPGEVIDGVLEELFCLVTGAVERIAAGDPYPPALYAVDQNIDKFAKRLEPRRSE